MDRDKNIDIVYQAGDHVQFKYGKEFGYYANQISNAQLAEFCDYVNKEFMKNSYKLCLFKLNNVEMGVRCKNFKKDLDFEIKLFDHSIYFSLNNFDWGKIDDDFFHFIQKKWCEFLELKIDECQYHMFSLNI